MTSSSKSHLLLFISLEVAFATVLMLVASWALGVGSSKLLSFKKARVLQVPRAGNNGPLKFFVGSFCLLND